jgi:hypothetical protein
MQIIKCNTTHKQKQRQKPHDYLNDTEKAFGKVPHLFMIKALMKLGIEGM